VFLSAVEVAEELVLVPMLQQVVVEEIQLGATT
jgi:hypothetical protein